MEKPMGYDEVQEFTPGKVLPKGGYICKIMKLEEGMSRNGNQTVYIYLDIAEGEYAGYFTEKYKMQKDPASAKWKCIYSQVVLDTTTKMTSKGFKSFTTSVEKSNAGFVVAKAWGADFAKFFKGRVIGAVFQDVYFKNDKGNPAHYAKPAYLCSTDTIKKGEFKIPEDDKTQLNSTGSAFGADPFAGFTQAAAADEDDLPF